MEIDRVAPTRRPDGPPAGFQKWRSLLFVHWELPAAALQALLPPALTVDTFEGRTYVGLVPFAMHDVRPTRWLPPAPTARDFLETNLRVYVHAGGRDPGVWFLSLDAASSLAVLAARTFFHLPYWRARMDCLRSGDEVRYRSQRLWAGDARASLDVRYTVGEELGIAPVGTLEHFLVERYCLYTAPARDRLLRLRVHHRPYPLRRARVQAVDESLVAAAGVDRHAAIASELWSEGVDVEIFSAERVRP